MPTYEYACRQCGHTFEIVQSFQDDPLTVCPECGGALRKVFAPPAITFKGSGFYATDHGRKSKPGESKGSDSKAAGSAASESGGSKDSKKDAPTSSSSTSTGSKEAS